MQKDTALSLIEDVFSVLNNGASTCDPIPRLKQILSDNGVKQLNENYSQIGFEISAADIAELREEKLINDNNDVMFVEDYQNLKPLEKLLYAVCWKNNDLKKIRHIINGITSEAEDLPSQAIVFHQFGKYLKKQGEPIIDQHVLRAFCLHKEHRKEEWFMTDTITKNHHTDIKEYCDWFKRICKKYAEINNFDFELDAILMSVGKAVKQKKMKK